MFPAPRMPTITVAITTLDTKHHTKHRLGGCWVLVSGVPEAFAPASAALSSTYRMATAAMSTP
jgi:hypothetical protein